MHHIPGRGIKSCEYAAHNSDSALDCAARLDTFSEPWSADREVFYKTLALYTAIIEHGCSLQLQAKDNMAYDADDNELGSVYASATSVDVLVCEGRIMLKKNKDNNYILE